MDDILSSKLYFEDELHVTSHLPFDYSHLSKEQKDDLMGRHRTGPQIQLLSATPVTCQQSSLIELINFLCPNSEGN